MYTTIEADLVNGRVKGRDAIPLPAKAHVLITVLDADIAPDRIRPDWSLIHAQLGKLHLRTNTSDWQRKIRSEWGD